MTLALREIVGALAAGAAIWTYVGIAIWFFLGTPYAIDAAECLDEQFKERRIQCLKPIAKKLRKDSIIATYATATVAAVIALQLSNRPPESKPLGE